MYLFDQKTIKPFRLTMTKEVIETIYNYSSFSDIKSAFEIFAKQYDVKIENCRLDIDYDYGYYDNDVSAHLTLNATVPKTEKELAAELKQYEKQQRDSERQQKLQQPTMPSMSSFKMPTFTPPKF